MDAFTAVHTRNGAVGLGVINAQPIFGDTIAQFADAARNLLEQKRFVAVALVPVIMRLSN